MRDLRSLSAGGTGASPSCPERDDWKACGEGGQVGKVGFEVGEGGEQTGTPWEGIEGTGRLYTE